MPLENAPTLIMCNDAETAHVLVTCVSEAQGDVVYTNNARDALHRLDQFSFDLAVIDSSPAADAVAKELKAQGIPFIVFGAPASEVKAVVVTDVSQVVPVLVKLRVP